MQAKVPGVKSAISRASDAKADVHLDAGERIYFGDLYLEVSLFLASHGTSLPHSPKRAVCTLDAEKSGNAT